MTGLALFGLQSKEQRAVLLYGAAGSGKSLYLKMIEALVPKEYRTSVSPLHMDSDYKNAALAGKRVNLVPEIDKDKPVPSAEFKAIIGGDTMSAREPYGKVFTFTPEAACWFNGNYYLTTKDHSEGFWRRWSIVHFANSKPERERDPKLLAQIIEQELPAVLAWAIREVQDYLDNDLFLSSAHHACIQEWKLDGNSISSWLNDVEDSAVGERKHRMSVPPLKVSHAYTIYKDWCHHNNRKPYNKTAFKAYIVNNGYPDSKYNGYSCNTTLYDARPLPGTMAKAN
nr:phage/plasmid primase, P4 family [Photobacterium sp. OFAV2-7]